MDILGGVQEWHVLLSFISAAGFLYWRISKHQQDLGAWRNKQEVNDDNHGDRLDKLEATVNGNGKGGLRDDVLHIKNDITSLKAGQVTLEQGPVSYTHLTLPTTPYV